MTPAGTSNEFDIQNKWEENTQQTQRTPSGSGKYIEFGLRIEAGADSTTIIAQIVDIIQQVRDTDIHLSVDGSGDPC